MPMDYKYVAIPDSEIPRASLPVLQHMLDTYASETNKVITVWRCFDLSAMSFRPHPRANTVHDILKHQLLSERCFFSEFMTVPEPPALEVLPTGENPQDYWMRMRELAHPRLAFLAVQTEAWWLEEVPFFDDLGILETVAPHLPSPRSTRDVSATTE